MSTTTTKDTTENTPADEAGLNSTQGKIQPADEARLKFATDETQQATKPPKDEGDTNTADTAAKPSEAPAKPENGDQGQEDKAARELAAVTKERDDLRVQVARLTVAHDKGVPVELLTATTPEELAAQADALVAYAATRTSAPDFGAGDRGDGSQAANTDPVRSIFQSR
jgi:hypothetical protein